MVNSSEETTNNCKVKTVVCTAIRVREMGTGSIKCTSSGGGGGGGGGGLIVWPWVLTVQHLGAIILT